MDRHLFVSQFGGVFEHSPFIAERAFDQGLVEEPMTLAGVHGGLCLVFRQASHIERLGVLRAHPDLAGKLAIAGELTQDSKNEQAGAGLDRLSAEEHARFTALNSTYTEKFGFPFIVAVKGLTKNDILEAFEARINNGSDAEFATACSQVEKIARLRIEAILTKD
ncbi:2-oxo-4-hydroxy-4-carboxy-5-ureidoimidazoline decarboxylase [Allorhizobium terrae]|uniref:2-oxo-4-hydroxy-4-carboxy-5-ureidoimidazoline decarboxylase n=1 Tax=Allorhizobium terrae TaxID=1848972 RepID=A0A4S4A5D5_9HYPH|nr:2-oxo-4-hydroxy-4-carboxy-5-ureidoimidazoline decarboxylase [Allorhizobium terrae]THF53712.1 2-oxo-4-hydroxy-4-carboxy-5-ureidoimidazoline decarboxylase [Allorhizobium terrae]TWD54277.1 OHCU decarboxylase [Agrobacterium vitis]